MHPSPQTVLNNKFTWLTSHVQCGRILFTRLQYLVVHLMQNEPIPILSTSKWSEWRSKKSALGNLHVEFYLNQSDVIDTGNVISIA